MTPVLERLARPVVLAPLAGGPSTPELAAAVTAAGGLGFLAGGYLDAARLEADLDAVRTAVGGPFGVNLFVPGPDAADAAALAAYRARLRPDAEALGVEPGVAAWDDDHFPAKLELVLRARPQVVSFTFGCPAPEAFRRLREAGVESWVTVTSAEEAAIARAAGADAVVAQGVEAGGHRAAFKADSLLPALDLVRVIAREQPGLAIVAAGGIAGATAAEAALAAGAAAVQAGTAFLDAAEAGTAPVHRRRLRTPAPTRLTLAFTGRRARGLVNAFMERHDEAAPEAYPHVHRLTQPIRAAARARGDASYLNLWSGSVPAEGDPERPAAAIVAELARSAR